MFDGGCMKHPIMAGLSDALIIALPIDKTLHATESPEFLTNE
jgi:hypothetical protein